jgi:hypothetical protein
MFRIRALRLPAWLLPAGLVVCLAPVFAGTALSASPPVMITVAAPTGTYEYFAHSVGAAGDVNGDGFADVIVGAYRDNVGGGLYTGRAFIFYGGVTPDSLPDVTLLGEAAGDDFGYSVGTAGDVNGDGYDDVIVGAHRSDSLSVDAGRAYVYFGGPAMDAVADLVLTGAQSGDQFGYSVGTAGDVNHDGYDDVIVGAILGDVGGASRGSAYIYYGGASPNAVADYFLGGPASNSYFGCAVGTAGDVNGDSYDDVIVGAEQAAKGYAYVYYGGPGPNNVADLTLTGEVAGDFFGCAVGTAGDVNGDGYDDVIVGANSNGAAGYQAGRAYLFHGAASPDAVADLTLTGETAGDLFGDAVGALGDVNDDGYDDVIVGAFGAGFAGGQSGRAYIYHGGPGADAQADATLTGRAEASNLGVSVGGAGDVNGDGHPEAIVGSMQDNHGRAFVYDLGPMPAACRLDQPLLGAAAGDRLGSAVGTAGDVNGDGYPDVIVGAPRNDAGGADAGRAYVYFGGPGADAVADWTLTGVAAGDYFGADVGTAGDVNHDGYDDVVVGAYGNDAGGSFAGQAYVFFGGASPDAVADLTMTGAASSDGFGSAVGTAGDVNGDGYADVIIGAYYNDAGGTNAGRAYVYFGSASPDAVADMLLTGLAVGDQFGYSVGTAGDVNGDGYADLIVGANYNDAGGTDAGRAYVYYGGASPDAVADVALTGLGTQDYFGSAVGTAGDVNGDGYADVIVGAANNDAGGSNAGRAYVYYGGASPDAVADLTLTGAAAGDYFGYSVGTAGDVNGDGYADLLIGAYLNDAGGSNAGRAYVYHGGWRVDTVADVVLTGLAAGDQFGQSVGTAGDLNGDGFSDLIVGASANDATGADAGAAYVYGCNRYFVTAPNGGELWSLGGEAVVSWRGSELADLWISLDDGATYELLQGAVGGVESNAAEVTVPGVSTVLARVKATPRDRWIGGSDASDSVFTIQGPTGVGLPGASALQLRAPWPNPASGAVRLGLELASESVVTVSLFDVAGREVARPIAGEKFAAGRVTREWRPVGLAPGVYTVRAAIGGTRLTRRLVWLGGR